MVERGQKGYRRSHHEKQKVNKMGKYAKHLKRERTECLIIDKRNVEDKPLKELFCEMKRKARFDTGYHYIVHRTGLVETDLDLEEVAGIQFKQKLLGVAILVPTVAGKMTTAQVKAFKALIGKLKETYQGVKHSYPTFADGSLLTMEG